MPEENRQEKNEDEIQKNEKEGPSLTKQIEELKASLKESQEKYLRVLADSENARKRMQKEREELMKYALENVLAEFIQPIDSFQKALRFAESMSPEVKNWAMGFEMMLNQFKQVLANHGVEEYHSVGKRFDPHFHEAVEMMETNEYEPGVVVEEESRGYKIGDRPIRVARVKVAKAPMGQASPKNNQKEEKEIKKEG